MPRKMYYWDSGRAYVVNGLYDAGIIVAIYHATEQSSLVPRTTSSMDDTWTVERAIEGEC